jgi:hypothetical protein
LLYVVQPLGVSSRTTPGYCKGRAHRRTTLGLSHRRVLVSRKWSEPGSDRRREGRDAQRGKWRRLVRWPDAITQAGMPEGFHFHDLRHTGNPLGDSARASTRELMHPDGARQQAPRSFISTPHTKETTRSRRRSAEGHAGRPSRRPRTRAVTRAKTMWPLYWSRWPSGR